LVPQAKGDFRLGSKLYDEKMRFALLSTMSRGELKARAVTAMAGVRGQMYAIARQVLPGKLPASPSAAEQQAGIEAALKLSYAQRPARAALEGDA
jgi:hypothetical protein